MGATEEWRRDRPSPTPEVAPPPSGGFRPHSRPGAGPARKRPVTTGAATAQPGDLCDLRDGAQFSDVGERDYGAAYILCMRVLGLSVGKGNGEYGPEDLLTRAQAASFLVRLWRDVLGRECPEVDHPFQDVASS
ncbi:MAG: S-layer homology domain-containing protein [Acidimicrobiia bacterium]|nr:S-layer homology domain-containing protein [Acidimicrobiia bacterium]